VTDTYSEAYRHQCEVRDIIAKRVQKGRPWAIGHLSKIEDARGRKARLALEKDILQQWNLGNRGEPGCWFEPPVA
jgi:hypothetical protein